jgi:hypothetical protein
MLVANDGIEMRPHAAQLGLPPNEFLADATGQQGVDNAVRHVDATAWSSVPAAGIGKPHVHNPELSAIQPDRSTFFVGTVTQVLQAFDGIAGNELISKSFMELAEGLEPPTL